MKLTKTLLLTALAVGGLLACASVRAQQSTNMPAIVPSAIAPSTNAPPHHFMGRGMSIDRLAQMLNLTADQKTKVAPIIDERNTKMHDVFQDSTLSPGDRMAKMKQIRADTDAQLKPILSAEQFQKWMQMSQPRMRRQMMPPPASPGAGNGGSAP